MADPKTPATPEVPPEKTPRPGKHAPRDDAGINANVTGSVYDPAEKPKLDPDDPGINANVVS